MGNCLVTKLNGIINNPYLLKEGEMLVYTNHHIGSGDIPANRKVTVIYKNVDKTLRCIDGNFVDANDQNIGKTINITKNTKTDFYVSNDSIFVIDCKDINYINVHSSRISKMNISAFIYADESLDDWYLPYNAYGNVSAFNGFTHFRFVNFWMAPGIIGDIANFSSSDPIIFTSSGSGITGDLSSIIHWNNCSIDVPAGVTYSQATYDQLVSQGCTVSGGTKI